MKLPLPPHSERGSELIIGLWIAFGLVTLALYFANSMGLELRAADNRVAGLEAEQAIAGAVRYASQVITNVTTPGSIPDVESYQRADVPVGQITCRGGWLSTYEVGQITCQAFVLAFLVKCRICVWVCTR